MAITVGKFFVIDQPALQKYFLDKYDPFVRSSYGILWWCFAIVVYLAYLIQLGNLYLDSEIKANGKCGIILSILLSIWVVFDMFY